ncbi:MAG: hypothetical protein STSR0008_06640 [Ignavibacterium sp.]
MRNFKTFIFSFTSFCLIFNFYLFSQVPDKPVLLYPIDGNPNVSKTPTFFWRDTSTSKADSFKIQISDDPTFYSIDFEPYVEADSGDTTQYTLISDLDLGSPYYWRVKGFNSSGEGSFSDIDTFIVAISGDSLPPVPQLSYPTDGTIVYTTSPSLNWYLLYNITGITYDIEFNSTGVFTGTSTFTNINALIYSLSGLTKGTKYYWAVRSVRGTDTSAWSSIDSFQVINVDSALLPFPSWPIGGAEIYTSSPTLKWYVNGLGAGLNYIVNIDTLIDFSTGTLIPSASNSVSVSDLKNGKMFYWRVKSYIDSDTSDWSNVDSFFVNSTGMALTPILSWPIGGALVYSTSTQLNWYLNGYAGALTYEIEIHESNSFTGTPSYSGITNNYYIISGLNYAKNYYWKVRSFDGIAYSNWSAADSFQVIGVDGSNVPILSWPIGGTTVYTSPQQLSWYLNGPFAGLTYDVEYNNDSVFIGTPTITGLTNNYTSINLTPGETYYWRVRSYDGVTYSAWSIVEKFIMFSGFDPARPVIGNPPLEMAIFTQNPVLSWYIQSPISNLTYELEYSLSPSFENSTVVENVEKTFYQLNTLEKEKYYYWRVRSKNESGSYSNFSRTASLIIKQLTDINNEANQVVPDKFYLSQNYPNPFNPLTIIKYGIPKSSLVTIKIYNIIGQQVRTLINEEKDAGEYQVQWDGKNDFGQNVSSGTYLYRVIAGDYVKTLKMILLR